jgi:predicted aspartyl protease
MTVETWVEGLKGNFLVDTGAGNSYLADRFAMALHAQTYGAGYTYNVKGAMQFGVADVNRMELGANRVPVAHRLIHVSDLRWANRGAANSGANAIQGIIGADILIHNGAIIDGAGSRIYFGNGEPRGLLSGRATNFLPRRGDEIAVVARVNGVPGTFIVDTGYNVSLIATGFAQQLGGGAKGRSVLAKTMEIGMNHLAVRPVDMVVSRGLDTTNQGYVELGEAPYDGLLGMDFLLANHVVIDCARGQIHFGGGNQ